MYPINKVRYNNDNKFPFELLSDVPRTIKVALKALNMHKMPGAATDSNQVTEEWHQQPALSLPKGGFIFEKPPLKQKSNELLKFLAYNESAFNNVVVYLFWIVVSSWFSDFENLRFPTKFIKQVREALCEQYRLMYFNYLLRLRQTVMDSIIDILPFLLAEIIKSLIKQKLRNEIPFQHNKTFLLLIGEVF